MSTSPRLRRLLLTGAAGGLGRVLRGTLKPCAERLRLSDWSDLGEAGEGEETVVCDLGDKAATIALARDVDAIVHLGGKSVEAPFEEILHSNIRGLFHMYEGARIHGVRRVIFASSNHVIGFYPRTERLDSGVLPRPDSYYGLSKAFGEDLSRFYFDRYGIETVCVRIGSSFPEPKDRRMLITWMSYADLTELVRCALFAPQVGHLIVYGVSANRDRWWDNSAAERLGFRARDSSEAFRAKVESQPAADPADRAEQFQGGAFVKAGPFDD